MLTLLGLPSHKHGLFLHLTRFFKISVYSVLFQLYAANTWKYRWFFDMSYNFAKFTYSSSFVIF